MTWVTVPARSGGAAEGDGTARGIHVAEPAAAHVDRAPRHQATAHPGAVQEFRNATHWPKHLLVHYVWRERKEEDEERGLLVLLSGARGGSRGRGRGWVGTGLMCCCLMQRLGGE